MNFSKLNGLFNKMPKGNANSSSVFGVFALLGLGLVAVNSYYYGTSLTTKLTSVTTPLNSIN
jgi:hypothetical protein